MNLKSDQPELKKGIRRTLRPWCWLFPALVLGALLLVTALSAERSYALGECAWHKLTPKTLVDTYSPDQVYKGEKPLSRLGGDDDDDDDDDDGGAA